MLLLQHLTLLIGYDKKYDKNMRKYQPPMIRTPDIKKH